MQKHNKFVRRTFSALLFLLCVLLFAGLKTPNVCEAGTTRIYFGFETNVLNKITILYIKDMRPVHAAEKEAAAIAEKKEIAAAYGAPWDATVNTDIDPKQINENTVYSITVNCVQNIVTVYVGDSSASASTPYLAFICSAGAYNHGTFEGSFRIQEKYRWRQMIDNSYAQYVTRFYQGIMFHSIPYAKKSNDSMILEDYELLGERASLGCIRLSTLDAKWIYENCGKGTKVSVYYSASKEEPLDRPSPPSLNDSIDDSTRSATQASGDARFTLGWDPTDPEEGNPYLQD